MGRLGIHFGFQLSTTVPQMLKEGYYLDSCLQEKIKETRSRLRRRCGLNWAVLCETIEGKQPVYYPVIVIFCFAKSKNQYKFTQYKN